MKKYLAIALALVFGASVQAADPPVRSAITQWGAVTTNTAGEPITGVQYRLYQGTRTGTKVPVATTTETTITVTSGLSSGEICFHVTAFKDALESEPSATACKTFPELAPAASSSFTVE